MPDFIYSFIFKILYLDAQNSFSRYGNATWYLGKLWIMQAKA